jgi:phosphopantetheinyl transferase
MPRWETQPPADPATGLSLDLWRWDSADRRVAAAGRLSREGTAAARRLRKDGALRQILARYLSCEPVDIAFGRSARGRPFVNYPQTPLDFNLSDSGDTVIIAVTGRGRVGVDIEYHRGIRDPMAIARRLLPATWFDELSGVPEPERPAAFFLLWTRFEACQKARGQGVFAQRTAEPHECFGAFVPAPGCSGHVCIAGLDAVPDRRAWRFFDFSPDD